MFGEWAIRELLKCLIWLCCFTSSTLEETPWMLISGFWNTIENPIWELFLSCRQKGNYTSYSHHLCRGSVFNLLLRVESTTLVMHFSKNKYFFPFFLFFFLHRFWAHIVMQYVFSFWTCYVLYKEYKIIATMRLHFIASENRRPDQFTVCLSTFILH